MDDYVQHETDRKTDELSRPPDNPSVVLRTRAHHVLLCNVLLRYEACVSRSPSGRSSLRCIYAICCRMPTIFLPHSAFGASFSTSEIPSCT